MPAAEKFVNGVRVTICPPGIAEGSNFQRHAWVKSLGRNLSSSLADDINPAGSEGPTYITLAETFAKSAGSLRDIITEGDDDAAVNA